MTRFFIYIIFSALLFCSCTSKTTKDNSNTSVVNTNKLTSISIKKKIHDFGEISRGEIIACYFYIENKGKNNLIIKKIETSCGCATINWKKKPIPPGGKTKIEVEFNSEGRYGKQYKVISIFANIPEKVKDVAITAMVK